MVKLSGLQKDVIHLYRQGIRVCYKKPTDKRPHFLNYVHEEFHKNAYLKRKDFTTIEYLLRVGKRKLDALADPSVKDIN